MPTFADLRELGVSGMPTSSIFYTFSINFFLNPHVFNIESFTINKREVSKIVPISYSIELVVYVNATFKRLAFYNIDFDFSISVNT